MKLRLMMTMRMLMVVLMTLQACSSELMKNEEPNLEAGGREETLPQLPVVREGGFAKIEVSFEAEVVCLRP